MSDIQVSEQSLVIDGRHLPLSYVRLADAQHVESLTRSAVIILLCLVGPIAAMVVGTLIYAPYYPEALRWGLVVLFGPVAIALGCALGLWWKKPWGVAIETEHAGYRFYRLADEDAARSLAADINTAVAKADTSAAA